MTKYIVVFLGLSFMLGGCSSNKPLSENKAGTLKKEKVIRVQQGTVVGIKDVAVKGEKSRVGGTVGSLAGSVLASGTIPYVGSLLGSMVGGAVGSSADDELSKKPGHEISLKLENGEQVTVTQLATTKFNIGDKVKLLLEDNVAQVVQL